MHVTPKEFTIKKLVQSFNAGSLLRNDEYQRGEVWTRYQKATFVDSVFRGYPVPALFFHRVERPGLDDTPVASYEIIDGQQRLTALRDFSAGNLQLLKTEGEPRLRLPKGVRSIPAPWAGKAFNELDEHLRAHYEDRTVTVFIVAPDAHPDEIRDLFIRLQSGTALTRQQVRDAWPGNVGPFIEKLAGKLKIKPSVKLFQVVDQRGQGSDDELKDNYVVDRQTCAQLLKIFTARAADPYAFPAVSANHLDTMYHEYTDFDPRGKLAEHFRELVEGATRVFERVTTELMVHSATKRKFRRLDVTVTMMYLQDASRDPNFKLGQTTFAALAKNIANCIVTPPSRLSPKGKGTSSSALKDYYAWWRDNVACGAGVRLDDKRLFDEQDKSIIRAREMGLCAICETSVDRDDEEYDHWPVPHRDGGPSIPTNGRLVHRRCHPRGRPLED